MNYSNPELIENSLYAFGWSHNEPVAVLNKRVYKNNLAIFINKNNEREDLMCWCYLFKARCCFSMLITGVKRL